MSENESMPAHEKSWSDRELLASILSRYCVVLEDLGGRTPTFLVSEKKDHDIHDDLEKINKHLAKLGFSARLFPDEPWILQLIKDPRFQWPSPRFVISMWLLSLITTIYAGEKWMNSGRPDGGWFTANASLDALIGYSLPIFISIFIASYVQKQIASKNGVHLPHLFPIPGPAMIWWPFGMIGFASLPRSDARLWPDRKSLGNSALSAPLFMLISGMMLMVIGFYLTPEIVTLTSTPVVVELPFLANIIALVMEGERLVYLKTTWAHPFTRAGMTLTFLGWIALLPIPTMPGGRILIARMGIPEARSGSSQVMLLLVVLLFAFLFGAFSEWNIWVPIVALCASLLITRGSDPSLPIVLDDFKGLPESDHRRIGIILFMAFMFALPAQIPFAEDNSWDDEISFSMNLKTTKISDNWLNQSVAITNPSLEEKYWEFEYYAGSYGSLNITSIDCDIGEITSPAKCSGFIPPMKSITISFDIEWLEDWNSTGFDLIWKTNKGFVSNSVVPELDVYPIGNWQFNGDYDDPKSCIELYVKSSIDWVNVSEAPDTTSWRDLDSEGNITVEKGSNSICLNGLSGDSMSWLSGELFIIENSSFVADFESENVISIPKEGIILDEQQLLFEYSYLAVDYNGTCEDLGVPSPPTIVVNNTTIWDMRVTDLGEYRLSNSSNDVLLIVSDGSIISKCTSIYEPEKYKVLEGPSLITYKSGVRTQDWLGSVDVVNNSLLLENPSQENLSISIEFDGNGEQWEISNEITLLGNETKSISAVPPESGESFIWFELKEGEIILHLVNHEV